MGQKLALYGLGTTLDMWATGSILAGLAGLQYLPAGVPPGLDQPARYEPMLRMRSPIRSLAGCRTTPARGGAGGVRTFSVMADSPA